MQCLECNNKVEGTGNRCDDCLYGLKVVKVKKYIIQPIEYRIVIKF